MDYKRVLVLSPHTDDAELGAGGTIARFIKEGKEIFFIVFSTCENSVPSGFPKDTLRNECLNSTRVMGLVPERVFILDYQVRTFPAQRQEILEDLIKFRRQIKPDLVLTPSSKDTHQDHGVIFWEALRAFKKGSSIWGYEHPWNNLAFTTDIFVKLADEHLEKKIEALTQYKSQGKRSYFADNYIRSMAYTRGTQVDLAYAETFELVRLVY